MKNILIISFALFSFALYGQGFVHPKVLGQLPASDQLYWVAGDTATGRGAWVSTDSLATLISTGTNSDIGELYALNDSTLIHVSSSGVRDTIQVSGSGGTPLTVGNADEIAFVNEAQDDLEYSGNFLYRDTTLYLETLPQSEGTPGLHIIRNADTSAVPIRTILIENNTEITGVTGDYHNQVQIALRAGVTQPWARYLKYEKHNGVTQYLNGAGQGSFIEYDSEFATHRKWFEYGGVSKYYSAGTGAFHINEHNAENPGTGGFIVSDGGTTASRLFQAGVNDHDVEMIANDGSTWYARFFGATKSFTLFGPGGININTNTHSAPAYLNFFSSDDQLSCNLFYATGGLRWNVGMATGADANYWILRYTGGGSLQDIPFQISNTTGVVQMPNSSASNATTIVGRTSTGEITVMDIDNASLLIDGGVLSVLTPEPDSFFVDTTGFICIITMTSDTICSDSVFYDDILGLLCVISMSDTTCVEFGGSVGTNIYNTSDFFTGDRIGFLDGKSLEFRTGLGASTTRLKINKPSGGSNVEISSPNFGTTPQLILQGESVTTQDAFVHFNGATTGTLMKDYSVGLKNSTGEFRIAPLNSLANPYLSIHGMKDSIVFNKSVTFADTVYDHTGAKGTIGQVLVADADGRVLWDDAGGVGNDSIPINHLLAATAANTIDNGAHTQQWAWNALTDNTGLLLTSNTTQATGSTSRLLGVSLTGINANSGVSTFAIHGSNAHGGGGHNYGIYGTAGGGAFNYGVYGQTSSSGGYAVFGSATTAGGGASLYGLQASSAGYALVASSNTSTTSGILTNTRFQRLLSSGTAVDGIGLSLDFIIRTDGGANSGSSAGSINSLWTDATEATRTSALDFYTVNSATTARKMRIAGDGRITLDGYVSGSFAGASTDSVLVINKTTGVVSYRDASLFGGGGGDDWGADVVNTDITLTGDGTSGNVLKVDTTIIASINYVDQIRAKHVKGATVQTPTASENISLWYTDHAITITRVSDAVLGTTPSVTYNIRFAATRNSGSPTDVFSSNRVANTEAGTTTTTFANASIPANSWVWLITSATSGTVDDFNVTIQYTQD